MKDVLKTTVLFTSLAGLVLSAGLAIGHEGEETKKDAKQARAAAITMEEAIQTAKATFPGRVVESELESEDGALVYEVEIVGESGEVQEIEIDAQSGKILGHTVEHENEDHEVEES